MASQKLPVQDHVKPLIQPAPVVKLRVGTEDIELRKGGRQYVFFKGENITVEVLDVLVPTDREPTSNGKSMFRLFLDDGTEHLEYVRTEQRARELCQKKYPNRQIQMVVAESH